MKEIIVFAIMVLALSAVLLSNLGKDAQVPDQSQLKQFSSYEELKSFLKTNQEVGRFYTTAAGTLTSKAAESTTAAQAPSASEDYSTTNIQVAGVDEADIVKNDGKYIYLVSNKNVLILDAYPAEQAKIISKVEFNETPTEIFVNKDRLIVFGQEYSQSPRPLPLSSEESPVKSGLAYPYYYSPKTFIQIYDISDRSNPVLTRNVSVDGNYFNSRMIGDYVYVVANQPVYYSDTIPLPTIYSGSDIRAIPVSNIYYFNYPDSSYIFTNILAVNTQNDNEDLSSKTFLMGYSQNMYVSPTNMYIVYTKTFNILDFYDRIIDKAILPAVPADIQNKIKGIRESDINQYEKLQKVGEILGTYLESLNPEKAADVLKDIQNKMSDVQKEISKEMEKTIIHKISLDGKKIEYKTKGEVPGYILNQFSMDEYNGNLRIATTTGQTFGWIGPLTTETVASGSASGVVSKPSITGEQIIVPPTPRPSTSQNNVYVLDNDLKIVGKVEDLAEGERIYSVRFLGDKGFLVTFRQIDPLFVIDLKNPNNPKVLGYLKIPGVSDYLHPYDENNLIGVGRDATEQGRMKGMKLSLFDISDVSNPKEISKYIIGESGTDSEALRDHKAFLFSKSKNLLVIPVRVSEGGKWNSWQGAYVFNLDLTNGFVLKGKVTHTSESVYKQEFYYDYLSEIRRSLYIDNVLYTVSGKMVKMNELSNLSEINKVELPQEQVEYPLYQ